jgi:predicted nucleic acid-binding protein
VLGWTEHTIASLTSAEDLLKRINEQPLNDESVKLCIQLRQTLPLKVPDAIIAATALYLEMPLMTRNTKDFQKVPNLKLFNPFEESSNNKLASPSQEMSDRQA